MEGYHSENQLAMAGLLAVAVRVRKRKRWKCPFGYCPSEFDTYSEVAGHILNAEFHRHHERFLHNEVGGLWASIICSLNEKQAWPTAQDIFQGDKAKAQIEVMPMTREMANKIWRTSYTKYTAEDIGHVRAMPRSPMEEVIHFLRRGASALTSADTSDVERP
jgi:hypothetical protein